MSEADANMVGAEAMIVALEIAAGHDGAAELVVSVRHENGVIAPVVLDAETAFSLMRAGGVAKLDALVGRGWRDFLNGTARARSACMTS